MTSQTTRPTRWRDGTRRWLRTVAAVTVASATVTGLVTATVSAPASAQPTAATTWLCRPDIADDPCDLPSDTTDLATGTVTTAAQAPDSDKPVDCFYVYPTVSDQIALSADPIASPEVQSIARYQAARFSNLCRVFAPVYRQVTLPGMPVALTVANQLFDVGYGDVLAAFNDYLAHDNGGRPVVFVSHSQGTLMLRKLLREQIDPIPALRARMAGALLMGGNVTTAAGSTTGGDFANIPVCTRRGEFGCVTAYSTDLISGLPSLFGNSTLDLLSHAAGLPNGPGYQVVCTDPAVLSGNGDPVGVTVPSEPYAFSIISVLLGYTTLPANPPTSASTWTTSAGRGIGQCQTVNGYQRYNLRFVTAEPLNELPLFDTHLIDINYGLDRLVDIADQQTRAWYAAH
ncbi:DUF3089 domain-containing protein [Nocardia salmonicida]|uniref:DUF3089 domain-containing protein n=1 Tax=Nocardia salmonicida TaxID=53431 RepID=UPI003417320E